MSELPGSGHGWGHAFLRRRLWLGPDPATGEQVTATYLTKAPSAAATGAKRPEAQRPASAELLLKAVRNIVSQ